MSSMIRDAAHVMLALTLCACVHALPVDDRAGAAMQANSMQTFEWRRVHGSGQYIDADALESERYTPLSTVLRTHLLGYDRPASALALGPVLGATCTTEVYVDGLWAPGALESGIDTKDLMGVEYYTAATVPIQFRRIENACPVLVLWLRH